jgi:excisionase family DNA binding protein
MSAEQVSPWLRIREASVYANVGRKLLYAAVRSGRLRAARLGGRREIRVRKEWIDSYVEEQSRT